MMAVVWFVLMFLGVPCCSEVLISGGSYTIIHWTPSTHSSSTRAPNNTSYELYPLGAQVAQSLVFYDKAPGSFFSWKVNPALLSTLLQLSNTSVSGLVIPSYSRDPGQEIICCCLVDYGIPVYVVDFPASQLIRNQLSEGLNYVNISILKIDENKWDNYYHGPWYALWWSTLLIMSGIALCLSAYKLAAYWRIEETKRNNNKTALICLVFEFLAALCRIIHLTLTASSFVISLPDVAVLFTFPYTFTSIITILLFFHWMEMIQKLNKRSGKTSLRPYNHTRRSLIVVCTFIILLELIFIFLHVLLYLPELIQPIPLFLAGVVGIGFALACFFVAVKVLLVVSEEKKVSASLKKNVRNFTILNVWSGILFLIAAILAFVDYFYSISLIGSVCVSYLMYFLLSVQSLLQIVMISVRSKSQGKTKNQIYTTNHQIAMQKKNTRANIHQDIKDPSEISNSDTTKPTEPETTRDTSDENASLAKLESHSTLNMLPNSEPELPQHATSEQ